MFILIVFHFWHYVVCKQRFSIIFFLIFMVVDNVNILVGVGLVGCSGGNGRSGGKVGMW